MAKTQYKLVESSHINKILEELNSVENLDWRIVGTIQEHGFTKVILEKELTDSEAKELIKSKEKK